MASDKSQTTRPPAWTEGAKAREAGRPVGATWLGCCKTPSLCRAFFARAGEVGPCGGCQTEAARYTAGLDRYRQSPPISDPPPR